MNTCLHCKKTLSQEAFYGLHQDCFVHCFGDNSYEFKELDPKNTSANPVSSPTLKRNNTFFHGRYRKYSAKLGQTDYILKIQETSFPELPIVEYLCNQIAELLEIEVPPYYLIDFNHEIAFVTRNFMQDYTGTLNHIYKFLPAGSEEEHYNCETLLHIILEQTHKLKDVNHFILICLFDAFIGNNDRHGRNLGIIQTTSMKKLAPMYDNPSCLGIEKDFFLTADMNPSGCIWTKHTKEPKPKDYIHEFQRLGYHKFVNDFLKQLRSHYPNIVSMIHNSLLSDARKKAFLRLLEKRMGDFENA